jgi:hypothetical protein
VLGSQPSAAAHPASFHDITSGTNSALEFDSSGNPVTIIGFDASPGWDPTTGLGSPIAPGLVGYLVKNVLPVTGSPRSRQTPRRIRNRMFGAT